MFDFLEVNTLKFRVFVVNSGIEVAYASREIRVSKPHNILFRMFGHSLATFKLQIFVERKPEVF